MQGALYLVGDRPQVPPSPCHLSILESSDSQIVFEGFSGVSGQNAVQEGKRC